MISEKEIKHIAKLARLSLTKKEIKKMQKEMSEILNYIEKLKEVDVTGIEPMRHSVPVVNVMRKDEEEKKREKEKILNLAPERKGDYIKAPKII